MKWVTRAAVHGGGKCFFLYDSRPTRKAELLPTGSCQSYLKGRKWRKPFSYYLHQLIMYKAAARRQASEPCSPLLIKALLHLIGNLPLEFCGDWCMLLRFFFVRVLGWQPLGGGVFENYVLLRIASDSWNHGLRSRWVEQTSCFRLCLFDCICFSFESNTAASRRNYSPASVCRHLTKKWPHIFLIFYEIMHCSLGTINTILLLTVECLWPTPKCYPAYF